MSIDARLETLQKKHNRLEDQLSDVMRHPSAEDEVIVELKRQKLKIKDQMERLKEEMRH